MVNLLRLINRMGFLSPQRRLMLYPPFWLMRIKVMELSEDWRSVRIKLPLTMLSRNMGGSMFGGNQASLADPIAALACVKCFPGYSVWTRSLMLDFLHEGSSDLELRFRFDPELEQHIKQELSQKGRSTPRFEYGYYHQDGTLCTKIECVVAIRPKGYQKRPSLTT